MIKTIPMKLKLNTLVILTALMFLTLYLLKYNNAALEDYVFVVTINLILMAAVYSGLAFGLVISLVAVLLFGMYYLYAIYIVDTKIKMADKEVICMIAFPVMAFIGGSLGDTFNFIAKLFKRYIGQIESLILTGHLGMIQTPEVFELSLKEECSRAKRALSQFTVLIIGVKNCDELQKLLGLDAKPEAVQKVSEILARTTRDIDKKARLDEATHALLLPDTTKEDSEKVLDRIKDQLSRVEMEYRGRPIKTTIEISIGRAIFPSDGKTDQELMKIARDSFNSNSHPQLEKHEQEITKGKGLKILSVKNKKDTT